MMDANLKNNRLISEQDESENTPESGPDSPPSSLFNDTKVAATSSPKRSKRGGSQKRVVSVPIKDVEGSRLRGENATPPSDSWAWRKYGQKPIKGSPYPRGYYRCSSSSKGCPARKQVERSTVDPATLLVTYSCEHNHPWPPPSRTNHHRHHRHHHHHHHHNNPPSSSSSSASFTAKPHPAKDPDAIKPESPGAKPENHFAADIAGDEPLVTIEEFAWFGRDDHQTWTSSTILDGPIFAEELRSADVGLFPMMREEDELLFADLGELPECSSVFRSHRGVGPQVQIC